CAREKDIPGRLHAARAAAVAARLGHTESEDRRERTEDSFRGQLFERTVSEDRRQKSEDR
ncbi:MAG: hypothetical protein LBD06_01540, partial [Candidatus Accumulibacter sp.]|nr:hypothetical protein [Accumulibacter sp.]